MAKTKIGPTKGFLRQGKYLLGIIIVLVLWSILRKPSTSRLSRELPSNLSPEAMAAEVRLAFLHAYRGYEKYAFGHDELKPLTNIYRDNFNGWGVSIYDALDTLHIMELRDEFKRAVKFIEKAKFPISKGGQVPFFETVIRYLGGMLSAYALSKDHTLLVRANHLGLSLLPAFNTSVGFPAFALDEFGKHVGPEIMPLSEVASFQLEYLYLGHITGNKQFMWAADKVQIRLTRMPLLPFGGMPVSFWYHSTGLPANQDLSVGSGSDSGIEYLLKTYLLSDKKDVGSLRMYLRSAVHIFASLLYISPDRHFLYATDTVDGKPSHRLEHLSCFLPGLFALASHTLPLEDLPAHLSLDSLSTGLPPDVRRDYEFVKEHGLLNLHAWAAEGLTETCAMLYTDQETGLSPDEVLVRGHGRTTLGGEKWLDALGKWKRTRKPGVKPPGVGPVSEGFQGRDYNIKKKEYPLRPETVESLYLMWQTTHNPRWRDLGWNIFQAIEREAKTKSGYATIYDVDSSPARLVDEMPSFFLAETLKYLYLLFTDEDKFPLDRWVWNTEAHAFPVFHRDVS